MAFSYRTRRALRRLGILVLTLVLLLSIALAAWVLWLDRYVVYTRDGAKLDFSSSSDELSGELALAPEDSATISIYYNEGDNAVNISTELVQVMGYYIDTEMLATEMTEMRSQLEKLPASTPVMVDVKDVVGRFYYSSNLGTNGSKVDTAAMDQLIKQMNSLDLYTIARVPALQDYRFGLENVPDGIPVDGGYLWMDPQTRCYWLDPASQGTLSFLMQIVSELKSLGFDEVIFDDFRIPEADAIVYPANREEVIAGAAKSLVAACSTETFAVSFASEDPDFPLPEGRSRLYLENTAAAEAAKLAANSGIADTAVNLVFLAQTNDTRYDDYGVLRPLTLAQLGE